MRRTLSVLITYHDERELLRECLQSLATQEFPPEEILIYDDASEFPATDYLIPGLPVRILRGDTNIGPSRARNELWRAARCEYVHFHDSDDWFDATWSGRLRVVLETEAPDAVFTEVTSHRDGKMFRERVMGLEVLADGGDLVKYCLHHAMLVPSGTYRRTLVESIGGYRESLWQSEDYDFHVRLAARQPIYRLLFDPLVHIRLRPESRSQNFSEVWTCRLDALNLLGAELPPFYRHELSEAATRVGSELFRLGEREEARRAFDLAQHFGPPQFQHQQRLYRLIARGLGAQTAEWVGSVYRNVLPSNVREKIRAGKK